MMAQFEGAKTDPALLVRPEGGVEASPLLDQQLRRFRRVEDLTAQAFVPKLAVEALVKAVIPSSVRR